MAVSNCSALFASVVCCRHAEERRRRTGLSEGCIPPLLKHPPSCTALLCVSSSCLFPRCLGHRQAELKPCKPFQVGTTALNPHVAPEPRHPLPAASTLGLISNTQPGTPHVQAFHELGLRSFQSTLLTKGLASGTLNHRGCPQHLLKSK